MASYPNAWAGWETAILKAAKLPVTTANIAFLDEWHQYEGSNARFNPLNVTGYQGGGVNTYGLGSINSAGVQTYGNAAQGAAATAAFLNFSNYTTIHDALASGDPYHFQAETNSNQQNLIANLSKWGSHSFAAVLEYEKPPTAKQGPFGLFGQGSSQDYSTTTSTGKKIDTQTTNSPPGLFDGLISWIKEYSIRTAEVVGGFFMLLVGLYLLARQIGLATNPPGPVGTAVGAVS